MSYLHGCNYPWSTDGTTSFYGLDFGANVWGLHLGVTTRRPAIARDFAEMAELGFRAVRWFVFCDGRSGIVFDDGGVPIGPDAHLFADVDAALEIARDAGIQIDFVLFDHRWMFRGLPESIADPVSGDLLDAHLPHGRSHVFLTADGRDALIERVLVPFVHRYGPGGARADLAPWVLAYEFMNEPDFVVDEWEQDLSGRVKRPLTFPILTELVSRLSEVVHHYSHALTTLGGARLRNLWAWEDAGLGLDFLQVHNYPGANPSGDGEDLFGLPACELGVRRPVLIGECVGRASALADVAEVERDLAEYLEFAVAAGYVGAWPWSFSGTDTYGRLPREQLRRFAERHPDLVNPRARK